MDHSECRQVGGGYNAHTHEGQKGWWAFPDDDEQGILELTDADRGA